MYLVHNKTYGKHQGIWVDKNIYDAMVDIGLFDGLPEDCLEDLENPDRLGNYYNIELLLENDQFTGVFSFDDDIDGIDGILPILPLYDVVSPGDQLSDSEIEYMISMEYKKFEQNPALYSAAMEKYDNKTYGKHKECPGLPPSWKSRRKYRRNS
jgi:hypothetical protein